jgi:hypothetical protein
VASIAKESDMIIFENGGIIERAAIFTMGVNVKENAQPIGHFGTGLKFAIATILRNGGEIQIFCGDAEVITFYTQQEVVRGKETAKVAALSVRSTQASSRPASVTSKAQFC